MNTISARGRAWRTALFMPILLGLACTEEAEVPADLVITNARIYAGAGPTIDRGSIVIRDGRLEAIVSSGPTPSALEAIDAEGMTVLPGLIDVHRHLIAYSGPGNEAELRHYIETDLPETLAACSPPD